MLRIAAVFIVVASLLQGCATHLNPRVTAVVNDKVSITADVVYGHKDGMALFYDVFTPPKANGTAVLYMVSGGWFSRWQEPSQRLISFQPLFDRGISVIAVYHGSAPLFKVTDAVADVRRAVRHVRINAASYGIDPNRLGAWGGSAAVFRSRSLGPRHAI